MATKRITTVNQEGVDKTTTVLGSEENKLALTSAPITIPEAASPQFEAYLDTETPGGAIYRYRLKQ